MPVGVAADLDLAHWDRLSPYCMRSKCGWYWIARAKVGDVYRYTLFKSPMLMLGTFDTAAEAKARWQEVRDGYV